MSSSEARTLANQQNALKSTGPKTEEGKARSRCNALKHGLTGAGMVLPIEDAAEVESMFTEMTRDMKPSTPISRILVKRMATMAIRLDRCVAQEAASLSGLIDQAHDDFVPPEGASDDQVARLRAEAGHRALFDASEAASLARKYEADAERSLYRALKEFRQVEKEVRAQFEVPKPVAAKASALGSFEQLGKMASLYAKIEGPAPKSAPKDSSTLSRMVATTPVKPLDTPFDLPISIGKPR